MHSHLWSTAKSHHRISRLVHRIINVVSYLPALSATPEAAQFSTGYGDTIVCTEDPDQRTMGFFWLPRGAVPVGSIGESRASDHADSGNSNSR